MSGKRILFDALKNFTFSLSQGLGAQAQAPGKRGSQMGMAAALGAPFQLQQMEQARLTQEQEEAMKIRQFEELLRQGKAQEAINALSQQSIRDERTSQNDARAVTAATGSVAPAVPLTVPPSAPPSNHVAMGPGGPIAAPPMMAGDTRFGMEQGTVQAPTSRGPVTVPSMQGQAQADAAKRQAELEMIRKSNEYTITDPTSGKVMTGPKDILDNLLTQQGQNTRSDADRAAQNARQTETMNAAARRHRDDMEQRNLDRDQRAKAAAMATTDRPPTAANLRTFGFYMRAKDAVDTLAGIEDDIKAMGLGAQTWQKLAPNFMQTQLGQTYNQAQRQFTEARLRKDSGAAIPPHEYDNDKQTYFVQPGDTDETLKRKAAARDVLTKSLQNESGRAYTQSFGQDEGGPPPMTAINPQTKERIESTDGGQTWHKAP